VSQIEKASGLSLVSDSFKYTARPLCRETSCQLVVRRFDDTKKKLEQGGKKLIGGGRN
jgi:endonuclease G